MRVAPCSTRCARCARRSSRDRWQGADRAVAGARGRGGVRRRRVEVHVLAVGVRDEHEAPDAPLRHGRQLGRIETRRDFVPGADEHVHIIELREQALDRMVEEAESLGANAIVSMRITTSMIMQSASEILAYGTAVIVE